MEKLQISYNSYIRLGTFIENNCVIGFSTEVKNTIIRDGAKISDLTFVGDSIIGRNSRIGSGVIVSNRCFNQSNVTVKDELKNKYDLGREVMGIVFCIFDLYRLRRKFMIKNQWLDNEKQVLSKASDWDYSKYN